MGSPRKPHGCTTTPPPTPRRRLEGQLGTPSPLRSPLRSPHASPEPNFLEAVLIEAYEDGIEGLFSGLSHDAP